MNEPVLSFRFGAALLGDGMGDGVIELAEPLNLGGLRLYKTTTLTSRGRPTSTFDKEKAVHFLAVLAEAKPTEIERFRQLDHPITCAARAALPGMRCGERLPPGNPWTWPPG